MGLAGDRSDCCQDGRREGSGVACSGRITGGLWCIMIHIESKRRMAPILQNQKKKVTMQGTTTVSERTNCAVCN